MGIVILVASTRVHTRYLKGLVPDTSIASICSVTRIEPNSAPMLEPTFPAAISAVISGARARIIAIDTKDGSHDCAPKLAKDGRDCLVKIKPVINPVNVISVNERTPVS